MEYRLFGRTGVRVAPLCIGALNFGNPTDEAEAPHIVDRTLDAGINYYVRHRQQLQQWRE